MSGQSPSEKSVDNYDWASLLEQGKLGTVTMPELEKYIKHHPLPNKDKKTGKTRCIALHLSAGNAYMGPQDNIKEEDEEEIEEEVVLAEVDSGDDSTDSDLDSESTDNESELTDVTMPNREKSLRHVAMVTKFLDDNKPIKSLKSLFALFQTSPILFNFI